MNAVRDNRVQSRYELELDGGTAFIDYRQSSPGVVILLHAEVPPELSGRGFGSALAHGALELVRAEGGQVIAQCPFIAAYIARHPEYQDLLSRPR
jgi:predicted GNAT family acetyltransferase